MMRRMEHSTVGDPDAPQATPAGPSKTGAVENTPEPLRLKSSKVPGLDLGFPQWLTRRLGEHFKRAAPKPL